MSRRKKPTRDNLEISFANKTEYRLRNYLHLNDIYPDNNDMHTIIINSFYNQYGGNNDDDWQHKVNVASTHFGKFCQYAQNNWKKQIINGHERSNIISN